jgi:hypothetical protein
MTAKARPAGGAYRALTIGVGEFAQPYPALRDAQRLGGDLREELVALGYACGEPVPTDWTSETVGVAVRDAITAAEANDVLIVHVLTHGEVSDETGKLYVLGRDGSRDGLADVEGWLATVEDHGKPAHDAGRKASPLVLFLLDVCQAGIAARLPWQGATADGSGRAWVLAACGPQEQAFNGRLTRATTTVLRRLRNRELDIAPSVEFVPLPTVAKEIRVEVARLAREEGDGLPQKVTCTRLDISVDSNLQFFRNPAFTANRLVALPPGTETALASFTDGIREPTTSAGAPERGGKQRTGETSTGKPTPASGPPAWASDTEALPADADLSPEHWADRIRGHGQISAAPDAGCFTGRLDQLNELVPWVQGWPSGGTPHTLSVVTGGPGAGKSALLGVLVCAAHPALRDATRSLWSQAHHPPPEIKHLMAVHARQRDLPDITGCLARQLNEIHPPEGTAQGPGPTSPGETTKAETALVAAADSVNVPMDPAGLVAAIAAAPGNAPVPVIVLDALDEALGSRAIVDRLIIPLVEARRPDGAPACRVLVGTRREGFERLLDAAAAQGGLIDLDDADPGQLLADLSGYVGKLLRTQPGYRDRAMARARGAFAEEVASALARQSDGDRRWGEFLIAGLYTHSFLRATGGAPVRSADEAGSRGADCPRTLPEVLELDLKARPNETELRQVLQIVAQAKGAGMPAGVIDRCRPGQPRFASWTPTLRLLGELGFYLRRANDEDGTTLYRIFHEGLADQLRPSPEAPEDYEEILLRASQSAWEPAWSRRTAEEALLEAMLRDLGDPRARRWDLAEPYVLRHALDHAVAAYEADGDSAELGVLLLDREYLVHAHPTVSATLQRLKDNDAATRASHLLAVAASWRGAESGETAETPPAAITRRRAVLALAAARTASPALAAALAEPPLGSPEPSLAWQPRWTSASDHGRELLWFAANVTTDPRPWPGVTFPSALSTGVINGKHVVVLGTTKGEIQVRSIADGQLVAAFHTGGSRLGWSPRNIWLSSSRQKREPVWTVAGHVIRAVALMQEAAAVSAADDGTIRVTELSTGAVVESTWKLDTTVVAVEAVVIAGRTIIAVTGTDHSITFIDLASGDTLNRIPPQESAITLRADGQSYRLRVLAQPDPGGHASGVDHVVSVTDANGEPRGTLAGHAGRISALTTMSLDGRPVAATASFDGTVRFWDVPALREIERLDLPSPVQALAPAGPVHLAVLCSAEAIIYARRETREGGA